MPPRRCLPSWQAGRCAGTVAGRRNLVVHEPHCGFTVVPGKSLARASRLSPARALPGTSSSGLHEDLHATSLHKDMHATMHVPLSLSLDVVDGVRALHLKGGGPVSASQAVPARILPGLRKPPRQGSCQGSSLSSALCLLLCTPWSSCIFPSTASSSLATGVATTARAQVRGTKGPKLMYTDTLSSLTLSKRVSLLILHSPGPKS